jgi:hypothetical protein
LNRSQDPANGLDKELDDELNKVPART